MYRLHYIDMGTAGEHAQIETRDGTYVCTVEQCSDEGRRRFRQRARRICNALSRADARGLEAAATTRARSGAR